MKNCYNLVVEVIILIILTFLYGCQKDETISNEENLLTEQLSLVERDYKSECISIKPENSNGKEETVANTLVKKKIENKLQDLMTKERSYLKSNGNTVGVIMNGSCGNHKTLTVFMDCEDDANNSEVNGNIGNISEDSYGNITMHFCVVDGAYFRRTRNDYAVLCLTSVNPEPGTYKIKRYFDNQDDDFSAWPDEYNANYIIYDGIKYDEFGTFGSCYFAANTLLSFYHYPKILNSNNDYPDIGISSYYVFGDFNNDGNGYVKFDDEDDSNSNWCTKEWVYYNNLHSESVSGAYSSIMYVDRNTKLFSSLVN